MKVTLDTKITIDAIDSLDNESVINNETIGLDTYADMAAGFKVVSTRSLPEVVTSSTYTNDLTNSLTNASFVSIQCNNYVSKPTEKPTAVPFSVSIGGVAAGDMSSIQFINSTSIPAIEITGIPSASTSYKVVLTIVIGYKS